MLQSIVLGQSDLLLKHSCQHIINLLIDTQASKYPSLEILMRFIPHKEKLMKTSKILPDDSRLRNEYVGVCK